MDINGKDQFYDRINDLKENHDLAVILVSHDFSYVAQYADQVVMIDKKIVSQGTPEEVFESKIFKDTFGEV